MKTLYTPSRQEASLIASIITIIIMYYTQSWHQVPMSYWAIAFAFFPRLFAYGITKWTTYGIGIITGMAISQDYTSLRWIPVYSGAQYGIILGFSMLSVVLTQVVEFSINRSNT